MKRTLGIKMIMPAIFLLVLGLGNIGVGYYKGLEYDRVLADLAPSENSSAFETVSPMRRMQIEREAASRLGERRRNAQARRDFYSLIMFGGKWFVVLGMLLFCCGIASSQYQRRKAPSKDAVDVAAES